MQKSLLSEKKCTKIWALGVQQLVSRAVSSKTLIVPEVHIKVLMYPLGHSDKLSSYTPKGTNFPKKNSNSTVYSLSFNKL